MSEKQTTDKAKITLTVSVFISVIVSTAIVVGFLYEIRLSITKQQERTHEAVIALQGKSWSIQDQVDWSRDLERDNKGLNLHVPNPRKTVIERLETSIVESKKSKAVHP